MAATLSVFPTASESVFDVARRLSELMQGAAEESADGKLPEGLRLRVADLVEALRKHVVAVITADQKPAQ